MDQLWRSPRIRPRSTVQRRGVLRATLLLVASVSFGGSSASPSLENYITARDGYIKKFKGTPLCDSCIRNALGDLETKIRPIVGEISLPGYPGPGKINLETLVNEVGFEMLDGMRYQDSGRRLVVTTQGLLDRYTASRRDLPKDFHKVAQANAFYSYALNSDAGFTNFVRILPPKSPGIDFALGSVGAFTQDYGEGMVPDQVLVYAKKGDRFYVVQVPATPVPAAIPQCDDIWKHSSQKPANEKNDLRRYQDCVRDKVQTPANLAAWKAQVQGILETLAKAP